MAAEHENGHHHHDHTAAPAEGDSAECPVMLGTLVSKQEAEETGLMREVDGQKYYLCCGTCASLFDADPQNYTTA